MFNKRNLIIVISLVLVFAFTSTAFAGNKVDLSGSIIDSSFSNPTTWVNEDEAGLLAGNSYYGAGLVAGEDCTVYGWFKYDPDMIFTNMTTNTVDHEAHYPENEGQSPAVSVKDGDNKLEVKFPRHPVTGKAEWVTIFYAVEGCSEVTIVIIPPPEDGALNCAPIPFAGEEMSEVGGKLINPNTQQPWDDTIHFLNHVSGGMFAFPSWAQDGQWQLFLNGVYTGRDVFVTRQGNDMKCAYPEGESQEDEGETIIIGDTSGFMLDGAVFANQPVGHDCVVYAGMSYAGTFSVQNDGQLFAHSNQVRARKADWKVFFCLPRIRISVQPEPTPILFTADACEGPECPVARCGLMEGTFIWNAAAGRHFGILQGEPTWFATYQDAIDAGLSFNGSECSNCGLGWQFRQTVDGSYEGWFGPNSTPIDSQNAADDFFAGSKDAQSVATNLEQAWKDAGRPIEGGWYSV